MTPPRERDRKVPDGTAADVDRAVKAREPPSTGAGAT
jgi:hypothetical protein